MIASAEFSMDGGQQDPERISSCNDVDPLIENYGHDFRITISPSPRPEDSGFQEEENNRGLWTELDKIADRPCYWVLRIFGLWHPPSCPRFLMWFHHFLSLLVFGTCCSLVIYLDVIHKHHISEVSPLELMNSFCTIIDFLCPFIFTIFYFKMQHYAKLVDVVRQVEESGSLIRRWKWIYNSITAILWALCSIFFYYHWKPFFVARWHHSAYLFVVFTLGGYWSTWLSIYAFVCSLHCIHMKKAWTKDVIESNEPMENQMKRIVTQHGKVLQQLEKSQSSFNLMISLSVAYHVVDIAVFSSAFWQQDFGATYEIAQYLGTLTFDLLTIFIKVYPAGKVATEGTAMAKRFNTCMMSQCAQNEAEMDKVLTVYSYLSIRSKEIGFKILGVRITQNVSYAIIVTIATATITFTSAITPILKH